MRLSLDKQSPESAAFQALNALGLLGISLSLLTAFYYQFAFAELPCPLCLLQRAGFILIGLGFLFNIRGGDRLSHYAMSLIGCVVTGIVAMRQVSLHIMPGDAGYGSTLFGLHFYTWAVTASLAVLVYITLVLALKDVIGKRAFPVPVVIATKGTTAVGVLFMCLILANLVSTVLECGGGQCADNPIHYLLLQ